jgi:geranylgeranyl diphosphate synthase type II
MTEHIRELLQLINEDIEKMDLQIEPAELYQPIRYILDLGGKRLRPLLALLSYGLYQSSPNDIVHIATGIEVFHNFTLMHDDIMDKAPLRRGKPSVHKKWTEEIGVLSGDVMLVKAYERFEQVPDDKILQVLKAFNTCAIEVCEGQQVDMNFEIQEEVSETSYLEMIRQKTAVLLGFSMELGAILADAPENHQNLLKEFGVNIGLGFQLKDDLLDVYGDQLKFGKQVGGDIISNKKTYLLIKALDLVTGNLQTELKQWLTVAEFDKKEKVAAVTRIYNELGIRQYAAEKINYYFKNAYQALDQLEIHNHQLAELRAYADYLTHRER